MKDKFVLDKSNIKTCINADDVVKQDYGIFANCLGDLKSEGHRDWCKGYVRKVLDETSAKRFQNYPTSSMCLDEWALFYPLEGAK